MSIKNKIIGYYSMTFTVIFIVVILLSTSLIRNYLYDDIKTDLRQEAIVFSSFLIESLQEAEELNPTFLSLLIETREKTRVYKFESTIGYIIYNNETEEILNKSAFINEKNESFFISNIKNKEDNIEFTAGNDQYFGILKNIGNNKNAEAVLAVARKKNLDLYILVVIKDSEAKAFIKDILKKQFYILIIAFLFVLMLGYFIGNSITKPLRLLHKQAKEMSKRNYHFKTAITANNEIGELSETINEMAIALERYEQIQNRFFQNASHELKTPLMSIKGYAEGMVDGLVEKNEENLTVIIEESDRLKKIVEGIALLTKIESKNDYFSFETVKINDVIKKAISKINGIAVGENISMEYIEANEITCKIDGDKFMQALLNIYGNCIRYAHSYVKTSLTASDCVKINIVDDGNGIKEKDLPYIFERFYKGENGENGLGLAITKAIIEKHNGNISCVNEHMAGAKFVIELPIDGKQDSNE